jgi:hypothetical protein
MAEQSVLGSIQAGCSSNRCGPTTRTSSLFCVPIARLPTYSVSSSFSSFPCLQFPRMDLDRMVFGPTEPRSVQYIWEYVSWSVNLPSLLRSAPSICTPSPECPFDRPQHKGNLVKSCLFCPLQTLHNATQ